MYKYYALNSDHRFQLTGFPCVCVYFTSPFVHLERESAMVLTQTQHYQTEVAQKGSECEKCR